MLPLNENIAIMIAAAHYRKRRQNPLILPAFLGFYSLPAVEQPGCPQPQVTSGVLPVPSQ